MTKRLAATESGALNYAIRDVTTGLYVNGQSYYRMTEQETPHLVGRLETARSHRRRAMREDHLPGPFVIQQVIVKHIVSDDVVEDAGIMERLSGLCRIPTEYRTEGNEILELAAMVENAMRKSAKARAMRYLMVLNTWPTLSRDEIKDMVRCRLLDGGLLLHGDSDLVVVRIMEGVEVDFIYDFETGLVIK